MNIVYPNLQINLSESGVGEDYCVKIFIDMTVVSVIRLNGILKCTMAQMAHFSFPYYFTIPNSEFRNFCSTNFGIRNCEVYIIWASCDSQSTLEGISNSKAKTKGCTT